jgi:hypothetical protein
MGVVSINNNPTALPMDSNLGLDSPFHDNGHIAHRTDRIRDWEWATKGFSQVGNLQYYGSGTTTYQKTLNNYFEEKPYVDGQTFVSGEWKDPNGKLDPISDVQDKNDNGINDSTGHNTYEAGGETPPTAWKSDYWDKGYFDRHLSPFNPSNIKFQTTFPMVELPVGNSSNRYTKAQVLKHTITHEILHSIGAGHSQDSTCVMYEYSNDWSRDGNIGNYAKGQIKIHNP